MRTIRELVEANGVLTLGERFDLWESRSNKNVLEDFPIGDLSDEQYHEVLDRLDIPRRALVIEDEIILISGLYKSEEFPYVVVEKNIEGKYHLLQVDNKNDWSDEQYKVLNRYSIFGV